MFQSNHKLETLRIWLASLRFAPVCATHCVDDPRGCSEASGNRSSEAILPQMAGSSCEGCEELQRLAVRRKRCSYSNSPETTRLRWAALAKRHRCSVAAALDFRHRYRFYDDWPNRLHPQSSTSISTAGLLGCDAAAQYRGAAASFRCDWWSEVFGLGSAKPQRLAEAKRSSLKSSRGERPPCVVCSSS